MNTELRWEHALHFLNSTDPSSGETLDRWRSVRPDACDDRDLVREQPG